MTKIDERIIATRSRIAAARAKPSYQRYLREDMERYMASLPLCARRAACVPGEKKTSVSGQNAAPGAVGTKSQDVRRYSPDRNSLVPPNCHQSATEKQGIPCKNKQSGTCGTSERGMGLVGEVSQFIRQYMVMDETDLFVLSAWIVASWMMDAWDRFPIVAITSPEMRCAKTRLLDLIGLLSKNMINSSSMTPAVIYRFLSKGRVTILVDEAQSLGREGNELMKEILGAGIDKKAAVWRCVGDNHEPTPFPTYGPKVIAKIGSLDGVLADRCLNIRMTRKSRADTVERILSRKIEPIAEALKTRISEWVEENEGYVTKHYDELEAFDIENDRMAECLMPLQAVLMVDAPSQVGQLEDYASLLEQDVASECHKSLGTQLLIACREIFMPSGSNGFASRPTGNLIKDLQSRTEEPWATLSHGKPITPHRLADLLGAYGIKPKKINNKLRGYYRVDFEKVWATYAPDRACP